jgi:lysozyme
MKLERLTEQLRFHEGVEHKVYKDHLGIETIGVGRNLVDRGLSDHEINVLLANDINICEEELNKKMPWWKELDEVRQRCLIDLVFNLGMPRFSQFVKTIKHLKNNEFEQASSELLDSNYARQVGARANRIAEMIRTGQDSEDF